MEARVGYLQGAVEQSLEIEDSRSRILRDFTLRDTLEQQTETLEQEKNGLIDEDEDLIERRDECSRSGTETVPI